MTSTWNRGGWKKVAVAMSAASAIIAGLLLTASHADAQDAQPVDVETAPQIVDVPNDEVSFNAAAAASFAGFAGAPSGGGYWIARTNGAVEAYSVDQFGDMAGKSLNGPIVGIASTATGKGYWLVASDGGIFSFGDAKFFGSMGGKALNKPVIGMSATASGKGYWLFASDGGVFSFGDAQFHGSTGGMKLQKPVVGMAPTADGKGYWEVASDGGIFAFDAKFYGSAASLKLQQPVVGMSRSDAGNGYRLVAKDGGVFNYGDAVSYGSTGAYKNMPAMVGITGRADDAAGYIVVGADGRTWEFGPDVVLPPAGSSPGCTIAGVSQPASSNLYTLQEIRNDGTPARWTPCVPIHWQLSSPDAPAGAQAVLTTAFTKLSSQTGLKFVYDGTTTDRIASRVAKMYNPDYTGKPVLIDFQASNGPEMCGTGGCSYQIRTPSKRILSSAVVLNKTASTDWSQPSSLGALALHEIGHTAGLNHYNDPNQVMNPVIGKAFTNYQLGDRNGLWLLGPGSVPLQPDEYN